jgi:hypothetical protein
MATQYRNAKVNVRYPADGVSTSLLHAPLPALQSPSALPIFSREPVSERPIIEESKLVLRIERQLDHALDKLIPGNAAKISQHELFGCSATGR